MARSHLSSLLREAIDRPRDPTREQVEGCGTEDEKCRGDRCPQFQNPPCLRLDAAQRETEPQYSDGLRGTALAFYITRGSEQFLVGRTFCLGRDGRPELDEPFSALLHLPRRRRRFEPCPRQGRRLHHRATALGQRLSSFTVDDDVCDVRIPQRPADRCPKQLLVLVVDA